MSWDSQLQELTTGTLHSFRDDLAAEGVPCAAGVYTIWDKEGSFLYVGRSDNLRKRLNDHASGRRSGDQFCIYVQDRLVLKTLKSENIEAISEAEESLDDRVKECVQAHLHYRFVEIADEIIVKKLEDYIKQSGLHIAVQPLLNPDD